MPSVGRSGAPDQGSRTWDRSASDNNIRKLRQQCLQTGQLFEDDDFPAEQASVFFHQTPPFQFVWKRPKDIVQNPMFLVDSPGAKFDITPGKLGDQWMASSLGVLYINKSLLYKVVPPDQTFEVEMGYTGMFYFRIFWMGDWQDVVVDDRLPTVNNKLMFVQATRSNQLWGALLEKAFAKLRGSYEALKYGSSAEGLTQLTGGLAEAVSLPRQPASALSLVAGLLQATSLVTALGAGPAGGPTAARRPDSSTASSGTSADTAENAHNGILPGRMYRIMRIEKVQTEEEKTQNLIKLRNPWCSVDYTGPWVQGSKEWETVPTSEKDRIKLNINAEGEFWMPFEEFSQSFTNLELVHLDGEVAKYEPSLMKKTPWQSRRTAGQWLSGVSAGGCRNFHDTFHINPQYLLTLTDSEDVLISLSQHNIAEPAVMGYSLYQVSKNPASRLRAKFFSEHVAKFHSQYTNSQHVVARYWLPLGRYVLVPTCFERGREEAYTLDVFSQGSLHTLSELDDSTKITSPILLKAPCGLEVPGIGSYQSHFTNHMDHNRSLSIFTLAEVLRDCLPEDLQCVARIGLCRKVILSLGCHGRLSLQGFTNFICSLKYWQAIHQEFACNGQYAGAQAGTKHSASAGSVGNEIPVEKIRDALSEAGVQVSTGVLSTLVLKHVSSEGAVGLEDFATMLMTLYHAFNLFYKLESEAGTVDSDVNQWVSSMVST